MDFLKCPIDHDRGSAATTDGNQKPNGGYAQVDKVEAEVFHRTILRQIRSVFDYNPGVPRSFAAIGASYTWLEVMMSIVAEREFLPIGKSRDLSGQKFGRLTAIGIVRKEGYRAYWLCACDCGNTIEARGSHLAGGSPVDCGKHSVTALAKEPKLLAVWKAMKQRCENPDCSSWGDYGARGITVCDEWQKYEVFEAWALSSGYAHGLSIDRINVDGHYSPSNCRFATRRQQQQNRRVNQYVTAWGETKCLEEWGRDIRAAVSANTLRARIERGVDPETAIKTPPKSNHRNQLT